MRSRSKSRRATLAAHAALLAGVVVAAGLLAACGGYAAASHASGYPTSPSAGDGASHPSVAEQATTLAATEGYRRFLLTSAERLTTELSAIAVAAAHGDATAARRDELAAQCDFDALRADIAPDSATAIQLDGEAWSVGAGPFTGLHLIERDLWATQDLGAARRAAAALVDLAVQTGYVFSRAVLHARPDRSPRPSSSSGGPWPSRSRAARSCTRTTTSPTSSRRSPRRAPPCPLPRRSGASSTPRPWRTCARRFALLDGVLGSLGNPATRTDATIPLAAWRSIAGALDAADGALGVLQGDVQGFGSGRLYA